VNQMMACSCGFLFRPEDVFCGNCGNPRPLAAPPDLPLPATQPTVPPTAIPGERAVRDGPRPFTHRQESWGPSAQPLGSAGAGPSPFDADATYLKQTLRHQPMELGLDDSVSLQTLAILLLRACFAWLIVSIVLDVLGGIFALKGDGEGLLTAAIFISGIVFWLVLLGSKVTDPIGEWRTLLPDRAGQAASYYNMIRVVLGRRELPINVDPQVRSIKLSVRGNPVKHTIVLFENEYQTYVTVFPYGTSLYVGWQMWRRRYGAQLIKHALISRMTPGGIVTTMLQTDRARAMREAVHLACREAVYAAPNEDMRADALQLQLPRVEQESALLQPQAPRPGLLAPPVPVPPVPPQTAAPIEKQYE
jgi:hypothetical protein